MWRYCRDNVIAKLFVMFSDPRIFLLHERRYGISKLSKKECGHKAHPAAGCLIINVLLLGTPPYIGHLPDSSIHCQLPPRTAIGRGWQSCHWGF